MKKALILIIGFSLGFNLQAQDRTEIEIFKAAFNKEKVDLVASFMDFTEPEGERFWPIYTEYEQARSSIADTRIKLLSQYANHYETLTNVQADYWAKEVLKLQKKELAVKSKFYKKMAKSLTPQLSLRFFQLEESLQATIRNEINKNLPPLENY